MRAVVAVVAVLACAAAVACADDRVKVVTLTESLCPNCVVFANQGFKEFMKATGVFERCAVSFLTWGNAYTETTSPKLCPSKTPGKYDVDVRKCWNARCNRHAEPELFAECFNISFKEHITCQHGEDECFGNLIETCALHVGRNTTDGYMTRASADFIECFLGENKGKKDSTLRCATRAGIDYDKIMSCVNSNEGTALLSEEAVETNDYGVHPGVPYVLVNGSPVPDGQTLLKMVCAVMQGTKPAGCKFTESAPANNEMC